MILAYLGRNEEDTTARRYGIFGYVTWGGALAAVKQANKQVNTIPEVMIAGSRVVVYIFTGSLSWNSLWEQA